MYLGEYLIKNRIRQSEFARLIRCNPSHLSLILSFRAKPGYHLAAVIENVTKGEVTIEEMLNVKIKHRTMDYSIFTPTKTVELPRVVEMIDRVCADDLLFSEPILVTEDKHVIDGHARLEAAKILKRPIFYVIETKTK